MINDIKTNAQARMAKSIDALRHTLTTIRTGRASPTLLDGIKVKAYGTDTPLNQVASISVSEGHQIAEAARAAVLAAQDDVLDVLVHVDPEVGDAADMAAGQLPSREILVPQLERLFADLPRPERMILHYLDGQIEIDLYFAASRLEDPGISGQIEARFSERARAEPLIRTLRFNFVVAP